MPTSVEIRDQLVDVLRLDLVGPEPGSPHEEEVLPQSPSRWYLTGFLVPHEAKPEQRTDATANEEIDQVPETAGVDEDTAPETASGRRVFLPSSMGLSVLVREGAASLRVVVTWGDYALDAGGGTWRRTPRSAEVDVPLGSRLSRPSRTVVPDSGGLSLVTSIRGAASTRAVSVFLVNNRDPMPDDEHRDEAFVFQAALTLRLERGFVPRPDPRGRDVEDPDERVADLQYRDVFEYAVGHGVASTATLGADGTCMEVRSVWVPSAEVEKVEPGTVDVQLSMEALAGAASAADLKAKLTKLPELYGQWIGQQRETLPPEAARREVGTDLMNRADVARRRIEDGIRALDEPLVFDAFRIANRAMAAAARQRARQAHVEGRPPAWRPFQLAFILMNLRGIAEPGHADREVVDLLFFPTGGGKTEAYLGLAAFTLVLRRLANPGLASAGVSVLMRYTLRLLTLDQLSRAATLICALEIERRKDPARLGPWPFEIGLWVGRAATPNRMGAKNDNDRESARARTIAFKNDSRKSPPVPLANCPWCGEPLKANSFVLTPNENNPTDLRLRCLSRHCTFKTPDGQRLDLPVVAVDEPIYRRLPCFVIATVDKFASLPWVGRVGALFGKVDRADREGFYGPCDAGVGNRLEKPLLPPDLIIQDELHLISGPLGTLVGLYETAIDALSSRTVGDKTVRPKVVVSTATVRRADPQVRALFARRSVDVFPPPGPDRRNSFFARTVPSTEKNARRYVGVAAQGRSLKVVLLRTYLALLAAAAKMYAAAGPGGSTSNPADPYMTLVGYFNSLRELGGTRRIVEDEVRSRLHRYGLRRRGGEAEGPFGDRDIPYEVVELTSREDTGRVAEAKRRLALPTHEEDAVPVALATNMISVGLDILRLGLMVVLGQPKTTAEYIQATSRVGRDDARPGLVVTLLNIHRPRDRSHYERFESYHASFYRGVEATSVTPFAPRAVDRGIAAISVALARHGHGGLTAPRQAEAVMQHRMDLGFVAQTIARRAEAHDARLTRSEADALQQKLTRRVADLLDSWERVARDKHEVGAGLQYNRTEETGPPLLFDPLDPEIERQPPHARKFVAQRSLRDVEPSVDVWMRRLDGGEVEEGDEE